MDFAKDRTRANFGKPDISAISAVVSLLVLAKIGQSCMLHKYVFGSKIKFSVFHPDSLENDVSTG